MKHFCSVADSNFRDRILALNYSLSKYSDDYTLHLLCLDKNIYSAIKDKNIQKYFIDDLLNNDIQLLNSKNNHPSREAINNAFGNLDRAKDIQFIWSLSPYFSNYCLNSISIDSILYIDSDIYFFDDWRQIYNTTNTNNISVGLVEHRIPFQHNNGKYNVGIVYFKNNDIGKSCSELWKNLLLTTDHQFYNTYGDCGDQKYLEIFPQLFPEVISIDQYFGHLAPWNFRFHQYTNNNQIIWENKIQNILYCHFSNFKPDYVNNTYLPAPRHGLNTISNNQNILNLYDEYFNALKQFQ